MGALCGRVEIGDQLGRREQVLGGERVLGFAENGTDHHLIGRGQGAGERLLEHPSPAGVGARLKDRPQTAPGIAQPHGFDGHRNSGRMVGKIVNDCHPARFSDQFLTACHAAKAGQTGCDLPAGQTQRVGQGDHAQGVAHVHAAH